MDATIPENLRSVLSGYGSAAVAFSGGVDSSYLLYAADRCCDRLTAYTVESAFRSPLERKNSERIADMLGITLTVIDADILSDSAVTANGPDRCYLCKKRVFSAILARAKADGFDVVCDATNATDDPGSRPGMKALEEMGIASPLRDCGIGKADVRALSRTAGLPCWSTPSDSCLATRIATGTVITAKLLERTARAENALRDLGFSGIRVRTLSDGTASFEVPAEQIPLTESLSEKISGILDSEYGTYAVTERIPQ